MARDNTVIPEKYKGKAIYSFSRLNTFNTCHYEYYQTYELNYSKKTNIYGLLGGFIHNLIEQLQKQEIKNDEAINLFNEKLLECDVFGVTFPNDNIKINFIESINHYLKNFKPVECKDFKIELEFYTTIGETETCILGYIDIVVLKDSNEVEIYDYKTSTMYDKQTLKEHGRQLIMYALALKNEYGVIPTKVAFNMLKYVEITYNNKGKLKKSKCQRNKIADTLSKYLIKELQQLNIPDFEIQFMLDKSIENNSLDNLPKEVQDKFAFNDYYLEYPINEETINDLNKFVDETVTNIQNKKTTFQEWETADINKNSFYCGVLCNQRSNCKYYKEYIENLNNNREDGELLKKIFG